MDQLVIGVARPSSPSAAAAAAAAAHGAYKIPAGDGPYARAKHYQLVEKDLDASIAWFWKAINSSDKVDSALKDMAVVMKQRGYHSEAIDAIKSLRPLCPKQSQESLDNILLDLYKASGRTKEEIELLKQKLRKIYLGEAFHGKTTKRARSHGRKIHVSVKQETSRVLGNLAWAYMQQGNFMAAEAVYRKAQMVDPDANKACNLALCLIEQRRLADAEAALAAADLMGGGGGKIVAKVEELMARIGGAKVEELMARIGGGGGEVEDCEMVELLDVVVREWAAPYRRSNRRLPVFEEITPVVCREQMQLASYYQKIIKSSKLFISSFVNVVVENS